MPNPTPRTVQSVDRAIAILQLLARSGEGLTLTALAAELDLPPQTAQSLLRTLQAHDMVIQEGRGRPYRLGAGVLTLASKWSSGTGLAAGARPIVADLANRTGEYATLAQLQGRTLIPLAEARAQQPLMVTHLAFDPEKLHVMATGKVLLAAMDEPQRAAVLAQLKLTAMGPRSVTDRTVFSQQLESIRRCGYAICLEENSPHLAALAVPVRDASRQVRAAIGVSLPMARYSEPRGRELLEALRDAAARIEQAWGMEE